MKLTHTQQHTLRQVFLSYLETEWPHHWETEGLGAFVSWQHLIKIRKQAVFLDVLLEKLQAKVKNAKLIPSEHTLRRYVFEPELRHLNIKYADTLARYMGFVDCQDFFGRNQISVNQELTVLTTDSPLPVVVIHHHHIVPKPEYWFKQFIFQHKNKILLSLLGIVLVISSLWAYQAWKYSEEAKQRTSLKVIVSTQGTYQKTIRLAIDARSLGRTGAFLAFEPDMDYHNVVHEDFKIPLPTLHDTLSHTFYKPGIKNIRLVARNGEVIRDTSLLVLTNDWVAYAQSFYSEGGVGLSKFSQAVPIQIFSRQQPYLHLNPIDITKAEMRDDYYCEFDLCREFGVNLDSLSIEYKVKNPRLDDAGNHSGQSCFEVQLKLNTTPRNTPVSLYLMGNPGCAGGGQLQVSEMNFNGESNKLIPALEIDMETWHTVKLEIKNRLCEVWLDGKKVFQTRYKKLLNTQLWDVQFSSKGSAFIDDVVIKNAFTEKVYYQQDFNGLKYVSKK